LGPKDLAKSIGRVEHLLCQLVADTVIRVCSVKHVPAVLISLFKHVELRLVELETLVVDVSSVLFHGDKALFRFFALRKEMSDLKVVKTARDWVDAALVHTFDALVFGHIEAHHQSWLYIQALHEIDL